MNDNTPLDPIEALASQKEGFENAQYDPEAPQNLSGVMSRWVVPEGYTEEEPRILQVPLFPVQREEEEEYDEDAEEEKKTDHSSRVLFIILTLVLFFSLMLNFLFAFFRG